MGRTTVLAKIVLLATFLVAAALRVGYFYKLHPEAVETPKSVTSRPVGDRTDLTKEAALRDHVWRREGYYGVLARNLRAEKRFAAWPPLGGQEAWAGGTEQPAPATAFVAPGYPFLLAAIYKFAPAKHLYAAVFAVQALIGALGCVFVFYLARRLFRSTLVGWLALVAATVSYFLVTSVVKIEPVVLASTMVTASVLSIVAAADSQAFWRHLVAGLVTGLTVLVAPAFLIVVPFAYIWMLAYGKGAPGKRFGMSLVAVLLFLLAVGPWSYRNYKTFNTPVPVVSSFGYHFWVGSNDWATGTDRYDASRSVLDAAREQGGPGEFAGLGDNEVARFRALAKRAWEWILVNPARSLELRLRNYAAFWTGRNAWAEQKFGLEHPLALPLTVLLLVLALVGVGAGKTNHQRSRAWMMYLVLLLYPLPYALTHVTALPTCRLPLDPLLMILAAYAVATLLSAGRVGKERAGAAEGPPADQAGAIPLSR